MIELNRVYLVGASGMGMAPLALYLNGAGVSVEAYDDNFKEPIRSILEENGIRVLSEPNPLYKPDCVVRSSAVGEDSELLNSFVKEGIPVYRRGDFLANFTRDKKIIAIVGSHGKTSTAGKLVWALRKKGFCFSYLIGGLFLDNKINSGKFENSEWIILEIDESDGTIDSFSPEITVALNCEWDHVDLYNSKDSINEVFRSLFNRTREVIITPNKGDLYDSAKLESAKKHYFFKCKNKPKYYKANNISAVCVIGEVLGFKIEESDLDDFPGLARRENVLYQSGTRIIVEDYAHHPTEISAFLGRRRNILPKHIMKVVFQPHRFSRTEALAKDFAEELSHADDLYFLQTYSAFEKYNPNGSVESLIGYLPPRLRSRARVFEDFRMLCDALNSNSKGSFNDQVLFVGAGDLEQWAHAFASWEIADFNKLVALGNFLSRKLSKKTLFREYEPLANKTTIGVGGCARWYAEPANTEDLRSLVEGCHIFGVQRAMIGRGSNLIIPDEGFDGLVIRLKGSFWKEISKRSDNSIIVGAGVRLKEICGFACNNDMLGFEFLEGIPGTLGGALRMNAGAMGWETFDLVEWVSFLMPDGKIKQILGTDLNVGYRYCREAYDGVALRAMLKSEGKSNHREIRNAIEKLAQRRRASQPREASAGCIFRNPEDVSAGLLIEEVGMKGEREGGAVVSNLHGNFILNEGGATANEIISLIQRVRERVRESKGMILEPEVTLLGKTWEQYLS
jgi:UDP-N-acetylenolpyruvoylglucosamine reductase